MSLWEEPQVTIKFPSEASRNAFVTWLRNIGGQQFCDADTFTAEREHRAPVDRLLFADESLPEQRLTNREITAVNL